MTVGFDEKARVYEESGLVQKAAGECLLELLAIAQEDDVLDLGCGSGGLSSRIAAATAGTVLGIDSSECMVSEASERYMNIENLNFLVKDAADLDDINAFDRIFCNSAFQWFSQPERVMSRCFAALKKGGVIGLQAPATAEYCPQFIYAMKKVACDPRTGDMFRHFKSPWLLLDHADDYRAILEGAGFEVEYCKMVSEKSIYTVDEVFGIFQSGAENGYLNQDYYDIPVEESYINLCRDIIRDAFLALGDNTGRIELVFIRVYLVARKPW